MDAASTTPRLQPGCDGGVLMQRLVRGRASDKSVRDLTVKVKVKDGQIIAEQATCGIVFSFTAAVWPKDASRQWQWIERLTPWWDMWIPDWTPQAQRLRESCVKALNKLFEAGASAPETANIVSRTGRQAARRDDGEIPKEQVSRELNKRPGLSKTESQNDPSSAWLGINIETQI